MKTIEGALLLYLRPDRCLPKRLGMQSIVVLQSSTRKPCGNDSVIAGAGARHSGRLDRATERSPRLNENRPTGESWSVLRTGYTVHPSDAGHRVHRYALQGSWLLEPHTVQKDRHRWCVGTPRG
jgi:hypothetical protein